MITRAYLRVSTDSQDLDNQRHGIEEYTTRRGLGPLEYIEDTASGAVDWRKRSLGEALDEMGDGDILIAAEISRIARSTLQLLEIFYLANTKGISIHLVKEGFVMDNSMMSEMMVTFLGAIATFERRLIAARTKEALARRKAAGLPVGRPRGRISESRKLDPYRDEILGYIEKGVPLASIAILVNSSRRGLYNWLETHGIETTAGRKKASNEPAPAPATNGGRLLEIVTKGKRPKPEQVQREGKFSPGRAATGTPRR
jgi:DNA invertase Pin-like site-specific DNA recombinase